MFRKTVFAYGSPVSLSILHKVTLLPPVLPPVLPPDSVADRAHYITCGFVHSLCINYLYPPHSVDNSAVL